MKNKGYTFIELLVVVSIISIVSVVSFVSFFQFLDRHDGETSVSLFFSNLNHFESEFQTKNILNYQLTLLTWYGYFYTQNQKSLLLSPVNVDFSWWTYTLSGNILYPTVAKIQEFRNGKYKGDKIIPWGSFYSWTFALLGEEQYIVFADDNEKNTFGFLYYSSPVDQNMAKNLLLNEIWTWPNKTGESLSGVIIEDFFWKKQLKKLDGTPLSSANLFFEKWGKPYSLSLTN